MHATNRRLMYRARRLCAVVVGGFVPIAIATGCATGIPKPAGRPTDLPRLGWVIMRGDVDNPDRDFVCQSNPRSECVVPADRPNARVLAAVYFYYHAAATETKFGGSNRIGFFDRAFDINADMTVKPGESPGNQRVTAFVSSKPGTYTMAIAVDATSTQTSQTKNIRDQVSVIVK